MVEGKLRGKLNKEGTSNFTFTLFFIFSALLLPLDIPSPLSSPSSFPCQLIPHNFIFYMRRNGRNALKMYSLRRSHPIFLTTLLDPLSPVPYRFHAPIISHFLPSFLDYSKLNPSPSPRSNPLTPSSFPVRRPPFHPRHLTLTIRCLSLLFHLTLFIPPFNHPGHSYHPSSPHPLAHFLAPFPSSSHSTKTFVLNPQADFDNVVLISKTIRSERDEMK